jgi:hypothetical protein
MSEPRLTNRTPYVVLALVVLLGVGAFIGWRVYEGRQVPPPVVVAEPQVVDAGVPEPTPAPVNLADGDALLKDGAAGISPDPELAKWLAQPDIIRRLVAAMVQVSEGESPRETLGFLTVTGDFSVVEKKDKKTKKKTTFMSPKSTARYDGVTKVIGSIDTAAAGQLYAKVRPFAESVFREIAPPGKQFDDAFQKAIDALAAVPITDAPLEVAPLDEGIGYRYVDPELESLTRAQKHLLRMGPANARVVVEKLKAFRAASNGQ